MKTTSTMTWVGAVGLALLGACVADLDDRPFPGGYETTATSSGSSGGSGTTASGTGTASGSGGMGGSSTGSTTSGGGGAGGMMIEPSCDPAIGPLEEACDGVYLHPGASDDRADGSQAHPYNDWATAIEKAGSGGLLWVCDGKEDVTAAVVLSAPITIHGGLDCDTWVEDDAGKGSRIEGAVAELIPLRILPGATGSVVKRVAVAAMDADNAKPGQSSVAVVVEQAQVTLEACVLTAGLGADGAPGTTPVVQSGSLDGIQGDPGADAALGSCLSQGGNSALSNVGGAKGSGACGGNDTSGGAGGTSTANYVVMIGSTFTAAPGDDAPSAGGMGGAGQLDNNTKCKPGGAGADGAPGAVGQPAPQLGLLDASGYSSPPGSTGLDGGFGLGGGGGGASLGKTCGAGSHIAGAAGGGGGAGACGGPGGPGGGAGGASVGLISLDATVTFLGGSITTADGGKGGTGAAGALGGTGGPKGAKGKNLSVQNIDDGCDGGNGGDGGLGGAGAGGNGGHSVALAFVGSAPDHGTLSVQTGSPGPSGNSVGNGGLSGFAGLSCSTLNFMTGECQ